jgi:cytoskeletal protein RodZ
MEADAGMDIGKILQDARIAKNLSLDTAAQETNIRKSYLEAIEQNDFASLHGDVFVKGVMRTYGNYLGLDGAQLVEEYKATSLGSVPVKNNNTIRESRNVKVRPTFKSNRDIGSGNGDGHTLLLIVIGVLVVLLAAAGGIYYYLTQTGQELNSLLPFRFGVVNETKEQNNNSVINGKDNTEQEKSISVSKEANNISEVKADEMKAKEAQTDEKVKDDATKLSVKAEEKNTSSEESSKNSSEKENAETKNITPDITVQGNGVTELKVASNGKCWLRVTDRKGTVLFEGNLLKGESKSFSSSSDIIMRIGNLKDLTIEHNGKVLPFEETIEPVTRIYTPREAR